MTLRFREEETVIEVLDVKVLVFPQEWLAASLLIF
jgi:hypothetical protein